MDKSSKIVANGIIESTIRNPNLKEVAITQMSANILKNKKLGLFQNELNYSILFPGFKPKNYSSFTNKAYRADSVGYLKDGFVLTEFKIFDEKLATKNPWGVMFYFEKDWRKLEEAKEHNKGRLQGVVQLIFAVRNTDFKKNTLQIKIMFNDWITKSIGESKRPPISYSNYYSILFVIKKVIEEQSESKWTFTFNKHGNVAFMVASSKL